jgi:hypothetical protein
VQAAEGKRVRRGKAASETKERGRGEKKRSAREVVENASSANFEQGVMDIFAKCWLLIGQIF